MSLDGIWTREQFIEMDAAFVAALEQAFPSRPGTSNVSQRRTLWHPQRLGRRGEMAGMAVGANGSLRPAAGGLGRVTRGSQRRFYGPFTSVV